MRGATAAAPHVPIAWETPSKNNESIMSVPTKFKLKNAPVVRDTSAVSASDALFVLSVPPVTAVLPVYDFTPSIVKVPPPDLVKPPEPMTEPLNVLDVPSAPVVKVTAAPSMFTEPRVALPPESEPTVSLHPLARSRC